jgi:xanthine/uracil/vitamin C permease (AzgA family)
MLTTILTFSVSVPTPAKVIIIVLSAAAFLAAWIPFGRELMDYCGKENHSAAQHKVMSIAAFRMFYVFSAALGCTLFALSGNVFYSIFVALFLAAFFTVLMPSSASAAWSALRAKK